MRELYSYFSETVSVGLCVWRVLNIESHVFAVCAAVRSGLEQGRGHDGQWRPLLRGTQVLLDWHSNPVLGSAQLLDDAKGSHAHHGLQGTSTLPARHPPKVMSHVIASCLVLQGEERGMLEARLVPHVTAEAPNLSGESDEDEPFIADSLEDMKGKRLGE